MTELVSAAAAAVAAEPIHGWPTQPNKQEPKNDLNIGSADTSSPVIKIIPCMVGLLSGNVYALVNKWIHPS